MTIDIRNRSVLQVAALLQAGAIDAVAVAEATLEAIEACEDKTIFTRVTRERALAEAQASAWRLREGRPHGVLDGVPVAWKDLFDFAGMPTTAGSAILAGAEPARRDAAVVRRLSEAGMVTFGRLNMTEFAFSGLGLNPHFGTPHNPHGRDVPRIPGGSSSGSAVVVARGLVPAAIGTDTGGSVRIPAAFNGIVGYKATRGRYPMEGVFPLSESLDSLGVLCRTVEDAVIVDAGLSGQIVPSVRRGTLDGLRLVVPENVVFDEIEPGVARAFQAALGRLADAGVRIEHRNLPLIDEVFAVSAAHGPLVTAEAFALHAGRLAGPEADGMDQRVVSRARLGERIGMRDYVAVLQARSRMIAAMGRALEPGVLVACPTLPHVAPPLAPLEADADLFVRTNARTLRNTLIGNFLDWCGVSIPCGTGDADMPVGFLLSGLSGQDEVLLSAALAAEATIRGEVAAA